MGKGWKLEIRFLVRESLQERNFFESNAVYNLSLSLSLSLFLSFPPEMETLMPVKDVAPIVAYLCHESFEENGSIIETTGGWVTKIKVQQGKGVVLKKPHTMEDGKTPSK